MRLSLKLGALCAAAAFLPLFITSLIILSEVSAHARQQALDQLRSDARAAGSLADKRLIEMRAASQALGDEIANRALVSSENLDRNNPAAWARLQDLLPRAQNENSLDFVIVTDPLGRVIARQNDRPAPGETLLAAGDHNPIAERVIAGGNVPAASWVIERGERYTRLGLDRIAQVRLPDGSTIDEALMIEAGAPIFSSGRFVGVVLIGQMLNTYYKPRASSNTLQTPLVAEARQTLYRNREEDAGAVIALGAAIIASSVPPDSARESASGPPLIGALHDTAKTEEALRNGARSYVVAWHPLKALDGTAIGAIGVARPARELEGEVNTLRTSTILIAAIATLAAGGAGFMFGRGLGARLDDLKQAASHWSLGELSTPARERDPFLSRWIRPEFLRDEINELAEQLDQLRESFRQAIERIRKR
jgi:HAMP domain-containing protein